MSNAFSNSQNSLSRTYGVPSSGRQLASFSPQSSLGFGRLNQYRTPGIQSSLGASRYSSSPSSQYGVPSLGYSNEGLGVGPSAPGGYYKGGYSQYDDQSVSHP